jgi:hypothetical protein
MVDVEGGHRAHEPAVPELRQGGHQRGRVGATREGDEDFVGLPEEAPALRGVENPPGERRQGPGS